MDLKHQQDIAFTHSFLNYLTAAYQGRFAALNIMQQLAFQGLNADEIPRTRQVLEKVRRWVADLSNGICVFSASWTAPETFEAQSAYKMLEDIKPELQQVAETTLLILNDASAPDQPQVIKYLISSYGRYAYSRDNYVKGSIEYGKTFGYDDIVQQYSTLLKASARDVEAAHTFLSTYKNPALVNEVFFRAMFDECLALPGLFRTHVHDINLLLAPYKGGLTFELADFFGPEIMQWQALNFDATTAGYWRAYGFDADEAAAWVQTGFEAPAFAFEWKSQGVKASEALPWAQGNFPAGLAVRWMRAGYNCFQAADYINRGINTPEEVDKA